MRYALILAALLLAPAISRADEAPAGEKPVVADSDTLNEALAEIRRRRSLAARARAASPQSYWIVPVEVDAERHVERFLLLLPDRPLIVDVAVTIDGKPFRDYRESMIDTLLDGADADEDGRVSWEELFARPAAKRGRMAAYLRNESQRKQFIRRHDIDKNGAADRFEVRRALAVSLGGPAFLAQDYGNRRFGNQPPALTSIIDKDGDGKLSAEELAAAPVRLASRDVDDNEILDAAELSRNVGAAFQQRGSGGTTGKPANPLFFHLAAEMNWLTLLDPLTALLKEKEPHPLRAKFARLLDRDDSGSISGREAMTLLTGPADVEIEVNLGETGDLPPGLSVVSVAEGLPPLAGSRNVASFEFPSARLQFVTAETNYRTSTYKAQAQAILTRFDADKNNYLEMKELKTPQARGYVRLFPQMDADGDGKVFGKEIEEYYSALYLPNVNRITAAAVEERGALFHLVDRNGDGRLGVREMQTAGERLAMADKDGDGDVSQEEIPVTIRFAIARSTSAFQAFGYRQTYRPGGAASRPAAGPRWFVHMDHNGDGDISEREFIGSASQFKSLDANGDGFIETNEAKSAE